MKRYQCDEKALETAREIMRLVNGPMPVGGSVQLLAQVQVLVTEAMLWASVEPAKQGEGQWRS